MDYLFQDGGKPKKTKSKSSTKTKSTKSKSKTSTKTGSKTTKSKTTTKKSSSKKGGNFLGAVGDLVAPTGWGPFATAAGLLALDRADSALRRGKSTKSEKSSAKKGGMRGGYTIEQLQPIKETIEQIVRDSRNLTPSNISTLSNIQRYYSEFLSLYNKFLELEKKVSNNSNNETNKFNMVRNLSAIIGILQSLLVTIVSIQHNKETHIQKDIIQKLLNLFPEITKIKDFIETQYKKYLSKYF